MPQLVFLKNLISEQISNEEFTEKKSGVPPLSAATIKQQMHLSG